MYVKNKETGEVETMRHGPASAAVEAGTHEFVNVDEKGEPKSNEKPKVESKADALDHMNKTELLAEAEKRGVAVESNATKAEIKAAIDAAAAK